MLPLRSCIACRKKQEKAQLIRIVSTEDKKAIFDKTQKMNARGIYICKNIECLKKIQKGIEKNKVKLKIPVTQESFRNLIENLMRELRE